MHSSSTFSFQSFKCSTFYLFVALILRHHTEHHSTSSLLLSFFLILLSFLGFSFLSLFLQWRFHNFFTVLDLFDSILLLAIWVAIRSSPSIIFSISRCVFNIVIVVICWISSSNRSFKFC